MSSKIIFVVSLLLPQPEKLKKLSKFVNYVLKVTPATSAGEGVKNSCRFRMMSKKLASLKNFPEIFNDLAALRACSYGGEPARLPCWPGS